ncbi:MAG: MATE family efflux transporter [Oscillospiraceae bacterium]|jgi:putative MATE family efflux protein|nr:MATE family efflux transporter [Oscillospiraceae bacterium]
MFRALRQEEGFYQNLAALTAPVVLQNIITTSLGFADIFMVGLLGNAEMAAVTAANVPVFIIQVVLFGFQSGMAVLVSQYWGRGDTENINRCLGVALYAATGFSTLVALITFLFPAQVLRLITPNEELVQLAVNYIRLVGFSYIFNSVSSVYAGVQRSTEYPAFGMILFGISMCVNTFLNFVLIFGHFGAPAMGVTGAAAATLSSRVVEFIVALAFAFRSKRLPLRLWCILLPGQDILRRFIRYSTPVVCNEAMWSLGTSMLTVIMGHMDNSQDMLAAYALIGNVDKLATVVCFGLAASAAVIVGKEIGLGHDRERVYSVSWTLLLASMLVGGVVMVLMLALLPTFFQPVLFPLFQLTPGAAEAAACLTVIYAVFMPMRAFDITNITGVLRAGGDARTAALIDIGPLWLVAVPLMALLGLALDAPTWLVCVAMQAENICKCPLGLLRFHSKRWINDVTRTA